MKKGERAVRLAERILKQRAVINEEAATREPAYLVKSNARAELAALVREARELMGR